MKAMMLQTSAYRLSIYDDVETTTANGEWACDRNHRAIVDDGLQLHV